MYHGFNVYSLLNYQNITLKLLPKHGNVQLEVEVITFPASVTVCRNTRGHVVSQ